jgi:hypothetical protein
MGLGDELPPAEGDDEEAPEEGEVLEESVDAEVEQKPVSGSVLHQKRVEGSFLLLTCLQAQSQPEGPANSTEPRELPASHPPNNAAHDLPQQLTGAGVQAPPAALDCSALTNSSSC